jgi:hypothetical protein
MKTNKLKQLASLALLATIGLVSAPTSATIVLGTDLYLGSDTLANSGDATELQAIKDMVGNQLLVLDGKADAKATDNGNGQWYIDLNDFAGITNKAPGYFLLKFGTGNTNNADSHYFFQNLHELDMLVFLGTTIPFSVGKLSHFTQTGPGDEVVPPEGSVPEPGSAALLGFGLLGLYLGRRRML